MITLLQFDGILFHNSNYKFRIGSYVEGGGLQLLDRKVLFTISSPSIPRLLILLFTTIGGHLLHVLLFSTPTIWYPSDSHFYALYTTTTVIYYPLPAYCHFDLLLPITIYNFYLLLLLSPLLTTCYSPITIQQ